MHKPRMTNRRWDIFCKVVDNYGDIGVCWRLAQQLAQEFPYIQVRLFVDNDATVAKIIPQLVSNQPSQIIQKVEICDWAFAEDCNADVAIETFGCSLPMAYLKSMQTTKPAWINLEYLSAEHWIADFHARPSLHPSLGLTKFFYFPGFTSGSGGLIREHDVLQKRDAFLAQSKALNQHLKISLFCYPQAQMNSLIIALLDLAKDGKKIELHIPFNSKICDFLTDFNDIFPDFNYRIGEVYHAENLTIHVLPFLSQIEYDQLLWQCDLNFVRGEDSWIRAIWAGKPFIWQPYIQSDDTHIKKLNAFLQTHFEHASDTLQSAVSNASHAWSIEHMNSERRKAIWQQLFDQLPAFEQYTNQRTATLAEQTSLANQLVAFSESLLKNKV